MILGLRTVNYHVTDLARAKAWYISALGKEPYFDEPFYVGFNVGGFELGLDPDMTERHPRHGRHRSLLGRRERRSRAGAT